jgi:hypothetical protein
MIRFEIKHNNVVVPIENPTGWQSLVFQLVRDEVYHGIDLNVITELTFIDTGYQILNTYIDNRDFDAELVLHLWYNDKLIRKFKLNLFEYQKKSFQITVGITEISFFEALKNRENIDIDVYEPNNIDGQPLSVVSKLGMPFEFPAIPIQAFSELDKQNFDFFGEIPDFDLSFTGLVNFRGLPELDVLNGEIQNTSGGGSKTQWIATPTIIEPFYIDAASQISGVINEYVVDYDLSGDIGDFCSTARARSTDWQINLYFGLRENLSVITLDSGTITGGAVNLQTQSYNIIGQQTLVSIPPKAVVFITVEVQTLFTTGAAGPNHVFRQGIDFSNWNIKVKQTSVLQNTFNKVTPIYEFTNRVLESITGKNDVLRSLHYGRTNSEPTSYSNNGLGSFRVVTNGFNIRGFDEQVNKESEDYKPPIIKFSDLFDSLNAIDNIGADVTEDAVIIETKEHFYQNSLIKNLGEIKDIQFRLKTSLYYNEIEVGYDDWEDTVDKGLSEFASKRKYTNRVKNNGKKYTIISNLIASPFAIETTRRDSKVFRPTAKSKWDNNNFIVETFKTLDINGQPLLDNPNTKNNVFAPPGTQITSVTNAASGDDLYNIEISPTRNLLRHQNILQGDLFFVSGEGNYKMKSTVENQFGGNELNEQQDLVATPTLFFPIIAKFEYPANIDEFISWNDLKYGFFEFENCSNIYKGFIDQIEFDSERNSCNFELILKA